MAGTYQASITVWKYFKVFTYIMLTGLIAMATGGMSIEGFIIPAMLVPVLEALANWIKHKDD